MVYSNLCSGVIQAANYTKGRNGYKVCKITPHHMAGKLTAKQCGYIFANKNRKASANYGIGDNGEVMCYVSEEDRSWASSNALNDYQAITIEVSNSQNGEPWPISEAAWDSLIKLCVDICLRYDFRLTYDGTPNGSLTCHRMFTNTTCPGRTLYDRLPELAETVNRLADDIADGYKALDYLAEKGRITNKEYWKTQIRNVKDLKYVFMKWSKDIK